MSLDLKAISLIYGGNVSRSAGRGGLDAEAKERMEAERDNILKLSKAGYTAKQIEDATGASRTTIYKLQYTNGYAKKRVKVKVKLKQIEDLVKAAPDFTYNTDQIAELTGINRLMVGKYIRGMDTVVKGTGANNKSLFKYKEIK